LPTGHKRKEYAYNTISIPSYSNSLLIQDGAELKLEAGNEITLNDGFWAKRGSEVTVNINPQWLNGMAITVPSWPSIVSGNGYRICPINADSWEFTLMDRNNAIVYQSAGSIRSDTVCLWDGNGVVMGGYLANVTLKNCYGRKLKHEHTLIVARTPSIQNENNSDNETSGHSQVEGCEMPCYTTEYGSIFSEMTNNEVLFKDVIYPNPTDGEITVGVDGKVQGIVVYNTQGLPVGGWHLRAITPDHVTLDLSPLPAGTYMLRITTPSGTATKKLVVTH
jgi:hypothetical protein